MPPATPTNDVSRTRRSVAADGDGTKPKPVDAVQGGPLQPLSAVLSALMRNAVLFRDVAYDAPTLALIRATPGPWSWSAAPTAETVRLAALYARLAAAPDPDYQPDAPAPDADALRSVIAEPGSIAAVVGDQAGLKQLARALNSDAATIGSVLSQLALAAGPSADTDFTTIWFLKAVCGRLPSTPTYFSSFARLQTQMVYK